MRLTRNQVLELFPDPDVDEPFPQAPVTSAGKRRLALLERAAWCLATGQPFPVWCDLTLDERNAFIDAVNARAARMR